ncbi:MAG: hypothetical protein GU361_02800 [Desulfurococcales archaeon]|jgi:hypothetical protein|nr:hypothetical protein [Fervidicoccaceae archaeon]NAZ11646.1 hypothetical protein [Desulfurococcales archaeon]
MDRKVKTTIVVDKDLWNKFKSRLLEEGIDEVSGIIEEMIREELVVEKVVEGLSELVNDELIQNVEPVKPLVETAAEKIVKELREPRY